MRKFLALLLAVLMVCGMSMVAFAEEVDSGVTGNKEGDVVVKVTDEDGNDVTIDNTYIVTVEWKDTEFHLEVSDPDKDITWDGEKYTVTNGTWDHEKATVTVTNKSDIGISVSAKWKNSATVASQVTSNVTATLNSLAAVALDNAVNGTNLVAEFTAEISEEPTTVESLEFVVDTIVLTISK